MSFQPFEMSLFHFRWKKIQKNQNTAKPELVAKRRKSRNLRRLFRIECSLSLSLSLSHSHSLSLSLFHFLSLSVPIHNASNLNEDYLIEHLSCPLRFEPMTKPDKNLNLAMTLSPWRLRVLQQLSMAVFLSQSLASFSLSQSISHSLFLSELNHNCHQSFFFSILKLNILSLQLFLSRNEYFKK